MMARITVTGWEDGEHVTRTLTGFTRWEIQAADELRIDIDGVTVVVKQRPKEMDADKMSVGAATWDGALVMTAFLASMPAYRHLGCRVVELGAGPGVPSLFAALRGAHAIITDIPKVVPLIEENIKVNQLDARVAGRGYAEARALEWGADGYMETVRSLSHSGVDVVLACDTCYIDPGDPSQLGEPQLPHFIAACKNLMTPQKTKFLLAFEPRTSAIRDRLLEELHTTFAVVEKIPSSRWSLILPCDHVELYCMTL